MRIYNFALKTLSAFLLMNAAAFAQTVELRSPDGLLSFTGEITEFNGFMLTVKTGHGMVNIPVTAVECFGDACPDGVKIGSRIPDVDVDQDLGLDVAFSRLADRTLLNERLLGPNMINAGITISLGGDGTVSLTPRSGGVVTMQLTDGYDTTGDLNINTTLFAADGNSGMSHSDEWASPVEASAQQLGSQALAVVASLASGVTEISIQNVARIYAGEITNWKELGGNDIAILPMQVSEDHEDYDLLTTAISAPFGKTVGDMTLTAPDEATMLQTLAIAPGGLAVVSMDALSGPNEPLAILDMCQRPMMPGEFEIASGQYPLTLSTFARVAQSQRKPEVTNIVDGFAELSAEILSSEFSRADRLNSILSGSINPALKETAGHFVQSIFAAEQLAMQFHGGSVPGTLAARSRLDFLTLAQAISRGDFDGQEIMFLGFTADRSDPGGSIQKSKDAAQTLLAAFQEFSPEAATRSNVTLTSNGHGSVGYSDCNPLGFNQAPTFIEVWVRPKA